VKVGKAIGEAGAEVKQGRRGLACHPPIAVRGPRGDTFEQGEHAAHLWPTIERRHKMDFGCPWIGEARIDAAGQQGVAEGVGADHFVSLSIIFEQNASDMRRLVIKPGCPRPP
jgi:hypothetical protein